MVLLPCVESYFFLFYVGKLACKVSAQEWKRILDIFFFLFNFSDILKTYNFEIYFRIVLFVFMERVLKY